MVVDEALRQQVRSERERRYRSIRQAAEAGGISNTQWGRFENGEIGLTQPMRAAIARAFDWPDDWPEREAGHVTPPRGPDPAVAELMGALQALGEQVGDQSQQLEDVAHRIGSLLDGFDARQERFDQRLDELAADVRRLAAQVLGQDPG